MDSGSSCACFHPAVGVWLLPETYMVILAGFCPVYTLKNRNLYLSVVKLSAAVGVSSSGSSRDTWRESKSSTKLGQGSRAPNGQGELENCIYRAAHFVSGLDKPVILKSFLCLQSTAAVGEFFVSLENNSCWGVLCVSRVQLRTKENPVVGWKTHTGP